MRRNVLDRLVLIGGGGHCRSVICSLRENEIYSRSDIVVIDPGLRPGDMVLGCRVVGNDNDLTALYTQGYKTAFISVGHISNSNKRRELYGLVSKTHYSLFTVIDKNSQVSEEAIVDGGVYISKGAIVNAGCRIGICSIVNSGAIVEHDCIVGSFCHVAVGAVVCGGVRIGDDTLVGANSTIIQGVKIGKGSIIGAGSTILADVPEYTKALGVWKG